MNSHQTISTYNYQRRIQKQLGLRAVILKTAIQFNRLANGRLNYKHPTARMIRNIVLGKYKALSRCNPDSDCPL